MRETYREKGRTPARVGRFVRGASPEAENAQQGWGEGGRHESVSRDLTGINSRLLMLARQIFLEIFSATFRLTPLVILIFQNV